MDLWWGIWTAFRPREGGIWTKNFPKNTNARGLPGGGCWSFDLTGTLHQANVWHHTSSDPWKRWDSNIERWSLRCQIIQRSYKKVIRSSRPHFISRWRPLILDKHGLCLTSYSFSPVQEMGFKYREMKFMATVVYLDVHVKCTKVSHKKVTKLQK